MYIDVQYVLYLRIPVFLWTLIKYEIHFVVLFYSFYKKLLMNNQLDTKVLSILYKPPTWIDRNDLVMMWKPLWFL